MNLSHFSQDWDYRSLVASHAIAYSGPLSDPFPDNGERDMSPDLDHALCERYPSIFVERFLPMKQTAMCRGIECNDGWYTLIDTLCAGLQDETTNGNAPQVVATQVKAKYGGLRFYVHNASDRQKAMIELAQHLSQRTCEICGAPGTQNQGECIRTRCGSHRASVVLEIEE